MAAGYIIPSTPTFQLKGGSAGQYLSTDGSGNLTWVTSGSGPASGAGGAPGQIQYNNSGTFGGLNTLTFNTTDDYTSSLNIGASANLLGFRTYGNFTPYNASYSVTSLAADDNRYIILMGSFSSALTTNYVYRSTDNGLTYSAIPVTAANNWNNVTKPASSRVAFWSSSAQAKIGYAYNYSLDSISTTTASTYRFDLAQFLGSNLIGVDNTTGNLYSWYVFGGADPAARAPGSGGIPTAIKTGNLTSLSTAYNLVYYVLFSTTDGKIIYLNTENPTSNSNYSSVTVGSLNLTDVKDISTSYSDSAIVTVTNNGQVYVGTINNTGAATLPTTWTNTRSVLNAATGNWQISYDLRTPTLRTFIWLKEGTFSTTWTVYSDINIKTVNSAPSNINTWTNQFTLTFPEAVQLISLESSKLYYSPSNPRTLYFAASTPSGKIYYGTYDLQTSVTSLNLQGPLKLTQSDSVSGQIIQSTGPNTAPVWVDRSDVGAKCYTGVVSAGGPVATNAQINASLPPGTVLKGGDLFLDTSPRSDNTQPMYIYFESPNYNSASGWRQIATVFNNLPG